MDIINEYFNAVKLIMPRCPPLPIFLFHDLDQIDVYLMHVYFSPHRLFLF